MLTAMFALLMSQVDLWIVAASSPRYCSPLDVAIYGIVVRLMFIVTLPLVVVNAVLLPEIASLWTHSKHPELERLLRTAATLAGIPSIAILAVMSVASGWILELMFGPTYRQGANVLLIACCGQLVAAWGGAPGSALAMTGRSKEVMIVAAAGFVVTLLAALCVVPRFGVTGVAVTSACGTALNRIVQLLLVRRSLNLWTHLDVRQFVPIALSLSTQSRRLFRLSREA